MQGPEHEAVFELLPWHANGTLGSEEGTRVEAHLADCEICRDELELCRATLGAVQETRDGGWEPAPGHLDRLLSKLPPEPSTAHVPAGPLATWREAPVGFRWAFAAQTAALLAIALALTWPGPGEAPPSYRTLTSETSETPAPGARPRIEVVFAEDSSEAELRRLLTAAGAILVDGPTPRGVYALAPRAEADEAALAKLLATLRASPHVRLAEPVAPPGPR